MDRKEKVRLGLLVACGAGLWVMGAAAVTEQKPTLVQRLLSDDTQEIRKAQNEIITSRKGLIEDLKRILGKSENRTRRQASVRAAILIMGEMRALECVEVLVKHIAFPYVCEHTAGPMLDAVEGGMIGYGLKGIQKTYPAVEALISIGEPCIDEVVNRLSVTDNVREIKACLAVLVALRDPPYVIHMLHEVVEQETDPKHVERLERAIDELMPKKDKTGEGARTR